MSSPTLITFTPLVTLCLLLWVTSDFVVAGIDEKWMEGVMIKELAKDGIEVERLMSVQLSPFDPPGGGLKYSNRTKAEISLFLKSGDSLNTSVVLVEHVNNDKIRKLVTELEFFNVDIAIYEDVLPKMDAFLDDKNSNEQRLWVRSYNLQKYTRLVLDDPGRHGYKIKNMRDGLDFEHCKVAVEALAKFHAISAVLKSKNLISIETFDKAKENQHRSTVSRINELLFKEFARLIRAKWGVPWEYHAEAFKNKSLTITEERKNIFKRDDSKFNVLLASVYYVNNLYFKYNDTCDSCESSEHHVPIDVKTLGFYSSQWNSPAFDLQLFINTSPQVEVMLDYGLRDKIVDHYANALNDSLKTFGYEGRVSLEYIRSEMQRTELIGLCHAIALLPKFYMRPEDQSLIEAENKRVKLFFKEMLLPRFTNVMQSRLALAAYEHII